MVINRSRGIQITYDTGLNQLFQARLTCLLESKRVSHVYTDSYSIAVAAPAVPTGLNITQVLQTDEGRTLQLMMWFEEGRVVGYLQMGWGTLMVMAAGALADVQKVVDKIKILLPPVDNYAVPDPNFVPLAFWHLTAVGRPDRYVRKIGVPAWKDIWPNYAAAVGDRLTSVMNITPATMPSGKVLLWTGPPGTGKTYAIRALARAWKPWCQAEYVIDPGALFGGNSNYVVEILMADHNDRPNEPESVTVGVEQAQTSAVSKWRLLILEDSGELIAEDAKAQTGQGLSRLLNMTDGLIGQGINLLILITTNEDITKLNNAVTRPGRCLSQIAFTSLSPLESQSWQRMHGVSVPARSLMTLAELYGSIATNRPAISGQAEKPKMGF